LEHAVDGVRVFAIHPGAVLSTLARNDQWVVPKAIDPPELSAWTMVRLTSGSEDYLSGRYFSSNWDLDDVRLVSSYHLGPVMTTTYSLPPSISSTPSRTRTSLPTDCRPRRHHRILTRYCIT
jgi:hypothetical protein